MTYQLLTDETRIVMWRQQLANLEAEYEALTIQRAMLLTARETLAGAKPPSGQALPKEWVEQIARMDNEARDLAMNLHINEQQRYRAQYYLDSLAPPPDDGAVHEPMPDGAAATVLEVGTVEEPSISDALAPAAA